MVGVGRRQQWSLKKERKKEEEERKIEREREREREREADKKTENTLSRLFWQLDTKMVTSEHRKANEYSLYPSLSVYSQRWVVTLHTDLECLFTKAGCQSPQ